jgi:hypothetical protein
LATQWKLTMKTKYRNLMLFTVCVVSCFWSLIFLFKFQMLCHWLIQGGFSITWWQVFAKILKLLPRYKHSPNMAKTNSKKNLEICWLFSLKNENIVIEYSLFIFIFCTKSLSLNSQCQARLVQAEPHLSISDFLSTYLVHLERKVHAQGLTKSFGAQ